MMNSVVMIGNLANDPELQTTQSGVSVCKFRIGVQRDYVQNGKRESDFFSVVVWRNMGENCAKYLSKGSKCAVMGRMENRSYETQNGEKRYVTEIIAEKVQFLNNQSHAAQTAPVHKTEPDDQGFIPDDDEMPF